MASIVDKIKERLAKRRAEKPERLRRRAEAKRHRIETKRRHETDSWSGGGG
jgi:hypothetical protein